MNKKTHIGVYGVIERENALLLVRKTRGPYTGMFDLPGGRPEHGEAPLETLSREVFEETGVKVEEASLLGNYGFKVDYETTSLHHIALRKL